MYVPSRRIHWIRTSHAPVTSWTLHCLLLTHSSTGPIQTYPVYLFTANVPHSRAATLSRRRKDLKCLRRIVRRLLEEKLRRTVLPKDVSRHTRGAASSCSAASPCVGLWHLRRAARTEGPKRARSASNSDMVDERLLQLADCLLLCVSLVCVKWAQSAPSMTCACSAPASSNRK